jgi:hypothetical protein
MKVKKVTKVASSVIPLLASEEGIILIHTACSFVQSVMAVGAVYDRA